MGILDGKSRAGVTATNEARLPALAATSRPPLSPSRLVFLFTTMGLSISKLFAGILGKKEMRKCCSLLAPCHMHRLSFFSPIYRHPHGSYALYNRLL